MSRARSIALHTLVLASLSFLPYRIAQAQATFVGLGDLSGGSYGSEALDVSADGSTVVGWSYSASGREAFRWRLGGGMVGLGDLAGGRFESIANAVSADGSVVVGTGSSFTDVDVYEAFRWTSGGGMEGLGDLPGYLYWSTGRAVSSDGEVVSGYSATSPGYQGFRWTPTGGMAGIGTLDAGESTFAHGISGDGGTIVGHWTGNGDYLAFRWTESSGVESIGFLPGHAEAAALGISADGTAIVGWSRDNPTRQAFRWASGTEMVGLGTLPGAPEFSAALDASADGSVVVGSVYSDWTFTPYKAFIWNEASGMQELGLVLSAHGVDLDGWTLESATGISDDGRVVVGFGRNPSGDAEAWMAVLPETETVPALSPPAIALMVGLLGMLSLRRLQRSRVHAAA